MEFREKNDSNSISDRLSDVDIGNAISVLFGLIVVGSIIVLVVLAVYAHASLKYKSFVSKDGISIDFYVASDSLDNAELLDYDYLTGNATFKTASGEDVTYNLVNTKGFYAAKAPILHVEGFTDRASVLPGLDKSTTKAFISYLISKQIYHDNIKVVDYHSDTGTLLYTTNNDTATHTLVMGTDGFYSNDPAPVQNTNDKDSNSSWFFWLLLPFALYVVLR